MSRPIFNQTRADVKALAHETCEQYEGDEDATVRLRAFPGDQRRDRDLFTDALGRILEDRGTGSGTKAPAPANATEIMAVKEQQKRLGERAEHFYSCFLESVFGDAYRPTRDWLSSARSCACGFTFVVLDTAQCIVPCQGKRSVRCFIEVKGSAGDFNGMFCLSANEQRKRDQIAASKSDGNAYVIAVVDNLDNSEFASIRHFIWSDDPQLLRLEADSFLARVDPAAGRAVAGCAAPPPAAKVNVPAAKAAQVQIFDISDGDAPEPEERDECSEEISRMRGLQEKQEAEMSQLAKELDHSRAQANDLQKAQAEQLAEITRISKERDECSEEISRMRGLQEKQEAEMSQLAKDLQQCREQLEMCKEQGKERTAAAVKKRLEAEDELQTLKKRYQKNMALVSRQSKELEETHELLVCLNDEAQAKSKIITDLYQELERALTCEDEYEDELLSAFPEQKAWKLLPCRSATGGPL